MKQPETTAPTAPASDTCACQSVTYDSAAARGLTSREVRRRWPRFSGPCTCGYHGIVYASKEHYLAGDW